MKPKRFYPKWHLLMALCFGLLTGLYAQEDLRESFENPPNEARPRVWWHWMNGNVTKDGIRKDLEWMERVGIGGFQNFDANLFTPPVVDNPLVFMTPDWQDAFRFTTDLAAEKGLEMAIAGSPGWSETGGPWVPREDGMKKYVWSETTVQGGNTLSGVLKKPSATTGHFQNIELESGSLIGEYVGEVPEYYSDALVVAYQIPDEEVSLADLQPRVSSSGGSFSLAMLTDNDLDHSETLPPAEIGEEIWIEYSFNEPQSFKAVTVVGSNGSELGNFFGNPENRSIQVSNDGLNFREVVRLPGNLVPQITMNFPEVTATHWRLVFETLPTENNPLATMMGAPPVPPTPKGVDVAEFQLHNTDRIDQFEDKAGFASWKEDTPSFTGPTTDAIPKQNVIDLTDQMGEDGTLRWQVPEGIWRIIRLGYSLTGRQNHPASPAGTGLEVDKLDDDAVRKYINTYLDMYDEATGGKLGPDGLGYIILDSYEAGHMTWSKDFPEEFAQRRGYAMTPWIPVLTGRLVESREASERFLWDFRRTIGELIVDNHYNVIGEELHKRGMQRYTESHEARRAYLADGMDVKRHSDIPMSAMWTPGSLSGGTEEELRSEADIREAASVAHIYGQKYVAAESMTSVGAPFIHTPEKLKRTADLEMANGLNRFVIHTSVHQPLDDKMPGFTLGPFGQYFSRQETWAEQARPWIDYLARSCYMLQQGRFVADALVFYGENTNLTHRFTEGSLPDIPGYSYDFGNSTVLLEALKVENGRLVSPGGGAYRILVLDESARDMTLPVLKKIAEFVRAGIPVTGTKPERTPSLEDDPAAFSALVDEVWGSSNVSEKKPADILAQNGIAKDVDIRDNVADILFVHRELPAAEVYWLHNRSSDKNSATVRFRVSGKEPMLWHPESGTREAVTWHLENDRTVVSLDFESWESYFIVFSGPADEAGNVLPEQTVTEMAVLNGPWEVNFQENRGAPQRTELNELISWTEHKESGIRYFSGTATYKKRFRLEAFPEDVSIMLDLGKVKDIAAVRINGEELGIRWKMPFTMNITEVLQEGENTLEVAITNVWANRMIGDLQPGTKEKITFTTLPFFQADAPLLPAGLLGPVRLLEVTLE